MRPICQSPIWSIFCELHLRKFYLLIFFLIILQSLKKIFRADAVRFCYKENFTEFQTYKHWQTDSINFINLIRKTSNIYLIQRSVLYVTKHLREKTMFIIHIRKTIFIDTVKSSQQLNKFTHFVAESSTSGSNTE